MSLFFYWISLYLFVPILPIFAKQVSGSNSLCWIDIGVLCDSTTSFFEFPFGISYDRANKKKLWIVFGLISIFIGVIWMSLSKNFTHLFIGRTITGIGAATWGIFFNIS